MNFTFSARIAAERRKDQEKEVGIRYIWHVCNMHCQAVERKRKKKFSCGGQMLCNVERCESKRKKKYENR